MWNTGQRLYDLLTWARDHTHNTDEREDLAYESDVIAEAMEDAATAPRPHQWSAYTRFAHRYETLLAQADME